MYEEEDSLKAAGRFIEIYNRALETSNLNSNAFFIKEKNEFADFFVRFFLSLAGDDDTFLLTSEEAEKMVEEISVPGNLIVSSDVVLGPSENLLYTLAHEQHHKIRKDKKDTSLFNDLYDEFLSNLQLVPYADRTTYADFLKGLLSNHYPSTLDHAEEFWLRIAETGTTDDFSKQLGDLYFTAKNSLIADHSSLLNKILQAEEKLKKERVLAEERAAEDYAAIQQLIAVRGARVAEPTAILGIPGGSEADIKKVREILGENADLFVIQAINEKDQASNVRKLYDEANKRGLPSVYIFDKEELSRNGARMALLQLVGTLRKNEFGVLQPLFDSLSKDYNLSEDAVEGGLSALLQKRSRRELISLIQNLPTLASFRLEKNGRQYVILGNDRVISAADLKAVADKIQTDFVETLTSNGRESVLGINEWADALLSIPSDIRTPLVKEIESQSRGNNILMRRAIVDPFLSENELPTKELAMAVPYAFFEKDPIGFVMHVKKIQDKHPNIHLILTAPRGVSLHSSIEQLFGSDIERLDENASVELISDRLKEKYSQVSNDQIAVLVDHALSKKEQKVLVVQLSPEAETSAGILESTAILLGKDKKSRDRILYRFDVKGNNYYIYLPPIMPESFYKLLKREKAQMAVGTFA
jgi:hypothetical protein